MSSKIKVDTIENVAGSGNVSLGSGHNLVVPGNQTVGGTLGVTGATTLTGDLTVDTNTIKVDSSNNKVGIGTSSPDTQLHISGNSSTRNSIVNCLTLDGGTAAANPYDGFGTGITFQGRDYGNAIRDYAYIRGQITNTTSNSGGGDAGLGTALTFWTTPTGAGSNVPLERMKIDKDGYVLKPNQVSFIATGSNNAYIQTSPVPFPTVIQNVGNGYNNSNYTFTAPVAGTYFFHFHCGIVNGGSSQQIYPYFQKNGANFMYSYTSIAATYYSQSHMTALVPLAASDTMRVTMATPSSSATYYNGAQESRFNGYLLG